MKVIYLNVNKPTKLPADTALCIGEFDGVHIGHQELIKAAGRLCKNIAIMTFEPHPEAIIKGINNIKLLTPISERLKVFEAYGVNIALVVNFDINVQKMDKNEFLKFLEKLSFKTIVCGHDFRFGYLGIGNKDDLMNAFDTYVVSKYEHFGKRVSSSRIRQLLSVGAIDDANELLGRKYHLSGLVIHGNQKGREIGFPTANIKYDDYYLPQTGVYIGEVFVKSKKYYGMINIGHNPTMNFQDELRVEVNIFEFDDDIYDEIIDIYFIERVRPEKKFISTDELIVELKRNKEYGIRKYLKGGK